MSRCMLQCIPVNCINCKNSISSHIGMSMFQACPDGRHQWFQEFSLFQFAQKPQSWSSNKFIWMLQVLWQKTTIQTSTSKVFYSTIIFTIFSCTLVLKSHMLFEIWKRPHLSVSITNQNHFLQHFAFLWVFWYNFPKYEQELFDCVILKRHNKANDCH